MCIAIYKPENIRIKKEALHNCFENNPDGAGFLVFDHVKNKLICLKGYMSFSAFWEAYRGYIYHRAIIHFRRKTSGEMDETNCHPFMVNDGLGFVHNGIINIKQEEKDKSDTWHFNEIVLKPLMLSYNDSWYHPVIKNLIESFVGKNNKIILMDEKANVLIYNEKEGEWRDGCWFSNSSYEYRQYNYRNIAYYGGKNANDFLDTKKINKKEEEDNKEIFLLEEFMFKAEAHDLKIISKQRSVATKSAKINEQDHVTLMPELTHVSIAEENNLNDNNEEETGREVVVNI